MTTRTPASIVAEFRESMAGYLPKNSIAYSWLRAQLDALAGTR